MGKKVKKRKTSAATLARLREMRRKYGLGEFKRTGATRRTKSGGRKMGRKRSFSRRGASGFGGGMVKKFLAGVGVGSIVGGGIAGAAAGYFLAGGLEGAVGGYASPMVANKLPLGGLLGGAGTSGASSGAWM